jgi:galactokinase
MQQVVAEAFEKKFGCLPTLLVRAPGRVNLIGEHTDYNDGFVLPMAIDRAAWIVLHPRLDRMVLVVSLDFRETIEFSLDRLEHGLPVWAEYIKGIAWALNDAGYPLSGWEGCLAGDVPVGAGLSSSAAVELATARAFAEVSGILWKPKEMAQLAQRAENHWVGVNCGIMDQMISAAGVAGHALLIDCRSLDTETAPLPVDTAVVVMDTGTRRGLVDSAYNERRAQCEAAARFFDVPALRDISMNDFELKASALPDIIRKRARHVISENQRTLQSVVAMHEGKPETLGKLMTASHISLRDDFEVSCQELDQIVKIALHQDACYGARMTGAGFGGCAVALVNSHNADKFVKDVSREYHAAVGIKPLLYICSAANGAESFQVTGANQG